VVTDMSAVFHPGDFVLIEGPSGSGKTSLLRLLNRLQDPAAGEILVDDMPVASLEVTRLRRQISYLQQVPVMLQGNVAENLRFPFRYGAARGLEVPSEERLQALLDQVRLDTKLDADATRLSQGEKQRLALIRALLQEPRVLLCDEPTSALDAESRRVVQEELERQNADKGRTVIVVTHVDFRPAAARLRRFHLNRREGLQEVAA
jgi:putative ABC transport system ATP-binding protein